MPLEADREFEELYREGLSAVIRAAHAISGSAQAAEDSAQEAFARALARWSRLRGQPWVMGWVVKTAMNHARRSRRRVSVPHAGGAATVDEDAILDLYRALKNLPSRQRQAVVLHYLLDLPVEGVAQALGTRVGTVKAHLSRARAALSRRLEVKEDA